MAPAVHVRHSAGLKLVIVHHHFRPGGVRRVIELAAPALVAGWQPRMNDILLVGGERPDAAWLRSFRRGLPGCPVRCAIEPALGYWSEQHARRPAKSRALAEAHLAHVLDGATAGDTLVWAHNPGLGRNLLLAQALTKACAARGVPLVFHHHDWWFDNRWTRWPEMRRTGFRSLAAVAAAILPRERCIRHAAINRADARVLTRHFGPQAGWIPNLAGREPALPPGEIARARRWLAGELAGRAPVWLVPCRLLRRKNIAEALLLTRWLRPDAWLVTTGGVSSAEEQPYAEALTQAARRRGWRLRLGLLAGGESAKPRLPALVAASEALLLTSLQEGFGLPYLEAAAAGRPLIARMLPGIAPDLARFGFRFPQAYDDVHVARTLFDGRAELQRQARRWRTWQQRLPAGYRSSAGQPRWLETGQWPDAVPFSRLTLAAQLEVLTHSVADSWAACAPLNPWLEDWRRRAAATELAVSPWPQRSARWLSGEAYARAVRRLVRMRAGEGVAPEAGRHAMDEFVRAKLAPANQYPLLWTDP